METILVATDFSESARNAVDYAANLALAMNAELCILNIYQIPVMYGEVPIPINGADARENAEGQLKKLKGEVIERIGGKIPVKTELQEGIFSREFEFVCDEINPTLVVMGSQGTSAVERFFFGSHTIHAMKHLDCPLITVPPQALFSTVKKIGLACDFAQGIRAIALETIRFIIKAFNAEFHVLNIGKKDEFNGTLVFESRVLKEKLYDLNPNYHFITGNDPDQGIMDFAEKNEMDLLVVMPRIHDLLEKLNHKSHAKQFILHSRVPVLSVRQ